MPLIPCKVCNASISDEAVSCPQCGHPQKKPEYKILNLTVRGSRTFDQDKLDRLVAAGWKIIDEEERDPYYNADGEYTCIMRYKLERYA